LLIQVIILKHLRHQNVLNLLKKLAQKGLLTRSKSQDPQFGQ